MSRSPWSVRLTGTAVVCWTGFWVLLPYFVISIFLANADLAGVGAATLVVVAVLIEAVLFALLLLWRRAAHRWPLLSAAPWRVFNVGNNHPEELTKVVEVLEKEFGRKAEKEMLPIQPGDVPATYADVDDLMREVGFRPSTSIEDGVARFAAWYREYHQLS